MYIMSKELEDKKEDISAVADRGESVTQMDPLLISESSPHRGALTDLAIDLAGKAAGFRSSLAPGIRTALADLVRSMNCYYSNLIEGHDTHPVDIERALKNDYSADRNKRDLQLEAKAHISVQQWLDAGNLRGRSVTSEGLREIHKRFCELLPDDMLWVEEPDTHERLRVVPGALRRNDVKVGRHIAISRAPFLASLPILKVSTAASARQMPFLRRLRRTIGFYGFIHFSMATDG